MSRKILNVEVIDVEKRRYPGKHYVYMINVHWSDGHSSVIYRRYSRFFDLQSKLLDMFPLEAGAIEPSQRIIPILPGKILFGRSHIREVALKRLKPIDDYCKGLIKVPEKISECDEVLDFFTMEPEDLDPPKQEDDNFFRRSRKSKKSKAEKISKPRKLKQYTVVADYNKQETGEIQLQQGMLVEVVEKSETGWWFVNSEDEQGWVPSTYLEPVDGDQESSTQRANPGEEEKYVCIETFTSENSDEISVEKGAIVDVIEKNLEGWWLIRYQGQEGMAPATYLQKRNNVFTRSLIEKGRASGVEIIGTLSDISDLLNKELKTDELKPDEEQTSNRLSYTIGPEGDTYTKVNLKSKSLERGGSLRPPPRQNSVVQAKEMSPPPTPSSKPSSYVTVADFTDPVGDGINFIAGQPVTVIEKGANDWWFVQIDGKEGWAPMSYIQSSTSQEATKQVSQPPVDELYDSSSSDSDSCQPAAPSASGIAAALQNKLNKQKKPETVSKPGDRPPPPPPSQNKKPLTAKPSLPTPIAKTASSKWQQQDANSTSSTRQSTVQKKTFESTSDDEEGTSVSGVSNLASVLKSKFETRQTHNISPSETNTTDSTNKKGAIPSRAVMPKNNSSKTHDVESGVNVRPVLPGRPVVGIKDTSEKPTLAFNKPLPPTKNTTEKPTLAFNKPLPPTKNTTEKPMLAFNKPLPPTKNTTERPTLAFNKPVPPGKKTTEKPALSFNKPLPPAKKTTEKPAVAFNKPELPGKTTMELSGHKAVVKRPSLPPPNLPAHPPGLHKKSVKQDADSNNNDDMPKQAGNVSGIAAALKSKFEQTDSDKAKPSLPPMQHGSAKRGKINSNWNTECVSASKPTSSHSTEHELNSIRKSKPVGDLVSALSGKLNFGADQQAKRQSFQSGQDGKPSLLRSAGEGHHTPLNNGKSKRYIAIAEYNSQGDGELFMEEGEEFTVLDEGDSGWWQVSNMNGDEGWVPASYLAVPDFQSDCNTEKDFRSDKSSINRPAQKAPLSKTHSTMKVQYKTTVLFTAENEGEIGFDEGEDVEVVEKTDDGWWFIRIGDSEGWAPADYIEETRVNVPDPGAAKPAPPKNKPVFKPMLPVRPR